jgi:DNA-binding winged helix-turn-helix (wHTH) protein/Tfp pilus assembly protein PilF
MIPHAFVYRFGPFELYPNTRCLTRAGARVALSYPQFGVLEELVLRAPDVVSRKRLSIAGWGSSAVSENSIEQAVSQLRKALCQNRHDKYIETVSGRGYRLAAVIQRVDAPEPAPTITGVDGSLLGFLRGRQALATLNRDDIRVARPDIEQLIRDRPHHAPAYVELAKACALLCEASFVDTHYDAEALACALESAAQATVLEPGSGEAWSTYGFVLYLAGHPKSANIAAYKGVVFDQANWRSHLLLSRVSWGEERITSAQRALSLRPDSALAYWLHATPLVGRGALVESLVPLRAGCAAQDNQSRVAATYPAVGLHLLHGLVLLAQNHVDAAIREFECELRDPASAQLYARQCMANTWHALGAIHLQRGEHERATAAFQQALRAGPGHFRSMAALMLPIPDLPPNDPRGIETAIARAIAFARAGRHHDAAQTYRDAISSSPYADAGWLLPVDPILQASKRPDIWGPLLAWMRERASS